MSDSIKQEFDTCFCYEDFRMSITAHSLHDNGCTRQVALDFTFGDEPIFVVVVTLPDELPTFARATTAYLNPAYHLLMREVRYAFSGSVSGGISGPTAGREAAVSIADTLLDELSRPLGDFTLARHEMHGYAQAGLLAESEKPAALSPSTNS